MTGQRLVHIDMLRGAAALLVCVGHVRGLLWVDYSALAYPNVVDRALYFLTGLGHQAVILFFALSGFLVGGAAFARIRAGTWRAGDYALRRLTRLWTVLLPALLFTWALDTLGRDVLGLGGYDGSYWPLLSSGPPPGQGADTSIAAFFTNALFLQTIAGPTFGSNGPLWSLANEFWYYCTIPLAWVALVSPYRWWVRFAAGLWSVAAMLLLPRELVMLGAIWLVGALAWRATTPLQSLEPRRRGWLAAALALPVLAGLVLIDLRPGMLADLLLGAATALWLPALACAPAWGGLYAKVSKAISEISYTLYVVHFPLLFFLASALFLPRQFAPDFIGMLWFTAATIVALLYAAVMWRLFERNTDHIRRRMTDMLQRT
ncbi:MAG: acyltransferase [Sphingopyxis sp.]